TSSSVLPSPMFIFGTSGLRSIVAVAASIQRSTMTSAPTTRMPATGNGRRTACSNGWLLGYTVALAPVFPAEGKFSLLDQRSCEVLGSPMSRSTRPPGQDLRVGEAEEGVGVFAPTTPAGSHAFKIGTAGNAILPRLLRQVGVKRALGVGVGPLARGGRICIRRGGRHDLGFGEARFPAPAPQIASGVRLATVAPCQLI